MSNSPFDPQIQFFQRLKSAIPAHASLVDEVAETLDLSIDSAYRRLRGEKLLDLEELSKLSRKFNISLDNLFSLNSNSILFQGIGDA